ncbi:MAG TPA: type IX secretion system membrane protein PorP/SprF [Saprospiraceae bacterium]|mgnify:FL=1|nr:type IX secretion system membrane protein PorP/SprF [Saprospiraceae bacterium]
MKLFLTAVFSLCWCWASAQDPIFSQFYAMPLQINPGFAGSSFAPRIGLAYRNQWAGFSNAYRTYAASYEQKLDRLNSGIGFNLEGDNAGAGILRSTRLSAVYAYQLNVNDELAFKLGVEAGAWQTNLDWDKLTFPDQIDPIGGIGNETGENRPDVTSQTRLDLSAGMMVLSEKFYLGGALKHLNTPNEGFLLINNNVTSGLPLRYTLHGGTEIIVKRGNKRTEPSFISPNFLFVSQGPYKQLNVGAYAGLNVMFAGAWYRHTFRNADALILLAGFRKDIFKIGVSYDLTVSGLAGRAGGTYEISFGILFDKNENIRKKKQRADINNCLRMFQ